MNRSREAAAIATSAIFGLGGVGADAAATSPRLLVGYRSWTLAELGLRSDIVYTSSPRAFRPRSRLAFRLPRGAREGGPSWYLVRLHYRITFNSTAKAGMVATVAASTNQVVCALMRFQRAPNRIKWVTADLIHGVVNHVTLAPVLEGWFSNYAAIAGIRGGLNRLEFVVAQPPRGPLKTVVILRDSRIEHSRVGPTTIRLVAAPSATRIVAGEPFEVTASVTNTGSRPAAHVRVRARALSPALTVLTPLRRVARIAPHDRARLVFRLRAAKRGVFTLALTAQANVASSGQVLHLRVRGRRR